MQIELIPSDPAYAELLLGWRKEANQVRFNPLASVTLEQLRQRLTAACSSFSDLQAAPEFLFFARVDGQLAGSVTLKNISTTMGYGEIGYSIAEALQGKGVGTAIVRVFVAKIFAETPLRRIFALVHEENQASRRLLERLGFRLEGCLREHYLIQGAPVNETFYGLLRRDWTEQHSPHGG